MYQQALQLYMFLKKEQQAPIDVELISEDKQPNLKYPTTEQPKAVCLDLEKVIR